MTGSSRPAILVDALSIKRGGGLTVLDRLARAYAGAGIRTVVAVATERVAETLGAGGGALPVVDLVANTAKARQAALFRTTRFGDLAARHGAGVVFSFNYHTPCRLPQVTYHINVIPFLDLRARIAAVGAVRAVLQRRAALSALRRSSMNLFESAHLFDLARRTGTPIRDPHVNHIGVDAPPEPLAGILPGRRIAAVTSGARHKRNDLLLDLHRRLNRERTGTDRIGLVVMGDADAIRAGLPEAARAYTDEQPDIVFTGYCDRPRLFRELAGSLCLATFSELESFYMVAIEAMMAGCPAVAAGISSIEESVGDAGLIFPPGDVAAAAGRIEDLLDPGTRRAVVERGLAWASRFDAEDCAAAIVRRTRPLWKDDGR